MKNTFLILLIVLSAWIVSCRNNVVCPAFQSTYILDDSIRRAHFSYFTADSVPKQFASTKKTKFGIIKKKHKLVRNYEMMTVKKENQLGPPQRDTIWYYEEAVPKEAIAELTSEQQDSLELEDDGFGLSLLDEYSDEEELDNSSTEEDDYLGADLLADADEESEGSEEEGKDEKKIKYKYGFHPKNPNNYDQKYYNKYFGKSLVEQKRPKPVVKEESTDDEETADSLSDEDTSYPEMDDVETDTATDDELETGLNDDSSEDDTPDEADDEYVDDEMSVDESEEGENEE